MDQSTAWFRRLTAFLVAFSALLGPGTSHAVTLQCRLFFAEAQNRPVPSYLPGFLPLVEGQSPRDRSQMPAFLSSIANKAALFFLQKRSLGEVLHWAVVQRRGHFHRVHFPRLPIESPVLRYAEWRLEPLSSVNVVLGRLDDPSRNARERVRLMVALYPDLVAEHQPLVRNPLIRSFPTHSGGHLIVRPAVTNSGQDPEISIQYPEGAGAALNIMNDASRHASFVVNVPGTPKSEFAAALHAYLNAYPLYQESVPLGLAVFAGLYAAAYREHMPIPRHLDIYAVAMTRDEFVRRYLAGEL